MLNAAGETARKKVLVVTDAYPPEVSGGAEISLKLMVDALAKGECGGEFDIVIAALSRRAAALSSEDVDGRRVWRLPHIDEWPVVASKTPAWRRLSRFGLMRALALRETYLRYLLAPSRRSIGQRYKTIGLWRALARRKLLRLFPLIDADFLDMGPAAPALREVIARESPDVIHADNYRSILLASEAKPPSARLIFHVRDNRFLCADREQKTNIRGRICTDCNFECLDEETAPFNEALAHLMGETRRLRREALARGDAIIATSAYLRDQIARLAPATPVRIAPNPADDVCFVDSIQKGVEPASPPEILIVGMVNANKGQAAVPRIIERLKDRLADFRIVLAGRGRMIDGIREQVAAQGRADHLITPGFLGREELYRAYARACLVLAPNVWPEPFGRAPLEAGLSRRPVVAYRSGGVCESVADGETGILVDPQDEDALVEAVAMLINDPQRRSKMGDAARKRILAKYPLTAPLDEIAALWRGDSIAPDSPAAAAAALRGAAQ
ncbi:MAG: hypothetical protein Tsb0010_13620 [Parvularculaceae bacterium]